jgi:hypothetical protein
VNALFHIGLAIGFTLGVILFSMVGIALGFGVMMTFGVGL